MGNLKFMGADFKMMENFFLKCRTTILTLMVISIFGIVGIFIASLLGRVEGLNAINKVYLTAAYVNRNEFQRVLDATDFEQLHLGMDTKKLEPAKQAWIQYLKGN